VHVLGVTHHSAVNARSVHEVAAAVKPDAVGFEYDSSDQTARKLITKAAQFAPMMKLVNRLMATPLDSYQQAHGQLTTEERQEWEEGLSSATIELGPFATRHYLLGRPAYSDAVAGVSVRLCVHGLFAVWPCVHGLFAVWPRDLPVKLTTS
jgi:hypothetical protein